MMKHILQPALQKLMKMLVQKHGNWFQQYIRSTPVVEVRMEENGRTISAETGGQLSHNVTIYLPYPTMDGSYDFEEVAQLFSATVAHEYLHILQLIKKDSKMKNIRGSRRGDFNNLNNNEYLSSPHEIEAYAQGSSNDVMINRNVLPIDHQAPQLHEKWLEATGIELCWATCVYFKKSQEAVTGLSKWHNYAD